MPIPRRCTTAAATLLLGLAALTGCGGDDEGVGIGEGGVVEPEDGAVEEEGAGATLGGEDAEED